MSVMPWKWAPLAIATVSVSALNVLFIEAMAGVNGELLPIWVALMALVLAGMFFTSEKGVNVVEGRIELRYGPFVESISLRDVAEITFIKELLSPKLWRKMPELLVSQIVVVLSCWITLIQLGRGLPYVIASLAASLAAQPFMTVVLISPSRAGYGHLLTLFAGLTSLGYSLYNWSLPLAVLGASGVMYGLLEFLKPRMKPLLLIRTDEKSYLILGDAKDLLLTAIKEVDDHEVA